MPGTFVTQRFQRNADGEMFERKVAADLIVLLDAIWARYDAGDYGSGEAGHAAYDDVDGVPQIWVFDADLAANPERPVGSTHGPQQIQLAPAT